MQKNLVRITGRTFDQLRSLKTTYNVYGYAASSILFEVGNTKVLCSVTMQNGVPPFLKGKGEGWLTAEYAMLPTATTIRTQRESSTMKKNGRSIEISRLIGRALRSVVDLTKMGERTIHIDCDVLQADGGTRTASLTGAYFALERAVAYWLERKELHNSIFVDGLAAISVGVYQGLSILDPDFSEDNLIDADFNFVIARSGKMIEVQGTAEKYPITWEQFDELKDLANKGVREIFEYFDRQNELLKSNLEEKEKVLDPSSKKSGSTKGTVPLFSLMNRLQQ